MRRHRALRTVLGMLALPGAVSAQEQARADSLERLVRRLLERGDAA